MMSNTAVDVSCCISFVNACFQFVRCSLDVEHRTVCVLIVVFAFKHGESEFSKRCHCPTCSDARHLRCLHG